RPDRGGDRGPQAEARRDPARGARARHGTLYGRRGMVVLAQVHALGGGGVGGPEAGGRPTAAEDRRLRAPDRERASETGGVPGVVTRLRDHQGALRLAPEALRGGPGGREPGAGTGDRTVPDPGSRASARGSGGAQPALAVVDGPDSRRRD